LLAFRKVEEDNDYLGGFSEVQDVTRNLELEEDFFGINNRFFVKFAYKSSETETSIKKFKESLDRPAVRREDADCIRFKIRKLQKQVWLLRELLHCVPTLDGKQLNELYKCDLMQIPLPQRWMMYNSWKVKAFEIQEERAAQLEKLYFENVNQLKDVRNLESAEICQKVDIVGLTTTAAARQRALLNHLKPKIGTILFSILQK
jgi:hypothetical protein